jgi:hypothetical protein
MHQHHLMPRQFEEFFGKRGIDIDAHAVQEFTKKLTTTVIDEVAGLPVTSLSGRTYMVGAAPAQSLPSETLQQGLQDTIGESVSSGTQGFVEVRDR